MRVRLLTLLLGCALCGCAGMQDYHYCLVQKHRADAAYKATYGHLGNRCSRDYKDGWKQGYFDISTGQCDDPPAVPPCKYWEPRYQSLDGKAAIEDWYSGWQDGATAAVQDGNAYFHEIATSPTVPQGPHGPGIFHGGGEAEDEGPMMEKLPPGQPSHDPQPQVHVAPVPQEFESAEMDSEDLLDESALPASYEPEAEAYEEYIADPYVTAEDSSDDGYFSAPPTGYEAPEVDEEEILDAGEYE